MEWGDGELNNQYPALEILQQMLWEILCKMLWEILRGILQEMVWEIIRDRVELKNLFKKAVIGGNLAFGMGDGEHPALQILWEMLWEILWDILQEMLWEVLWKILWEKL